MDSKAELQWTVVRRQGIYLIPHCGRVLLAEEQRLL